MIRTYHSAFASSTSWGFTHIFNLGS